MAPFEIQRSATIAAPRERVHALIDDFHAWRDWSPWEDVDPELQRDYSGADSGAGARYAWEGNRRAGKGSMEILESSPERIEIRLVFEKPWTADNQVVFDLVESSPGQTDVSWRMTGENKGFRAIASKLFNMEKFVGRDFEKGLSRLKAKAEPGAIG